MGILRQTFLFVFIFICLNQVCAQKEGNIWLFGDNAGVDFNSGSPTPFSGNVLDQQEGFANICNKKGQLLFYTDGENVKTKTHKDMFFLPTLPFSKLFGSWSSTQSGVIVPRPKVGNLYFVFSVGREGAPLQYVQVDTTAFGGEGMVFTDTTTLLNYSTEKITAVKHANGEDLWIIGHELGNNKFYAWQMTALGLTTKPVISSVGPTHQLGNSRRGFSKGYMKASPKGDKIAAAIVGQQNTGWRSSTTDGRIEIYDFDNATGKVTNPVVLTNSNRPSGIYEYDGAYGVEFSPNGKFLYVSQWGVYRSDRQVVQIDLQAGSSNNIINSVHQIASISGQSNNTTNNFGALQIGPDGKIYCARNNRAYMSVIEKPNCPKAAASWKDIGPSISGSCNFGLPTFIQSFFFKPDFYIGNRNFKNDNDPTGLCFSDSTEFWLDDVSNLDSVKWDFGDTASKSANFSNRFSPKHYFSDTGTYEITLYYFRKNVTACEQKTDTVSRTISIFPYPKSALLSDTLICQGEELKVNVSTSGASYTWEGPNISAPNKTKASQTLKTKGTYRVAVSVGGCIARDTFLLDIVDPVLIDLGKDTTICSADSFKVTIDISAFDSVKWHTQSSLSFAYGQADSFLAIKAFTASCFDEDTLYFGKSINPIFDVLDDTTICSLDSFVVSQKREVSSWDFLWSDGSTDTFFQISKQGKYWLTISDTLCSTTDSINVYSSNPAKISLGSDRVICEGDSTVFFFNESSWKYKWHDASADSLYVSRKGEQIRVEIFDGYCFVRDTAEVSRTTPYKTVIPSDTTICIGDTVFPLPSPPAQYDLLWNETNTNNIKISTSGQYRLKLTKFPLGECVIFDTINVVVNPKPMLDLGPDTTLCFGENIILDASTVPNTKSILWHDGNANDFIRANEPNVEINWVEIFDGICSVSDSIKITQIAEISFDLGRDTTLCDNQTYYIEQNYPNADNYAWYENDLNTNVSSQNGYTINSPGTKILEVKIGSCFGLDTIEAIYKSTPVFELGKDTILCEGEKLDISTKILAEKYEWSSGESDSFISVNTEDRYAVVVSNGPCKSADSINVGFATFPNVILIDDTLLCSPTILSFDLSQKYTKIRWENGSLDNERAISQKGIYYAVASNVCGSDSAGFEVDVDPFGCAVQIPNAFSPNGDNLNEVFRITGSVEEFKEFVIFNRWGQIIYESYGNPSWDGKINDKTAQQGAYYYYIRYSKYVGNFIEEFNKKGVIYLIN